MGVGECAQQAGHCLGRGGFVFGCVEGRDRTSDFPVEVLLWRIATRAGRLSPRSKPGLILPNQPLDVATPTSLSMRAWFGNKPSIWPPRLCHSNNTFSE